MICLICPTRGRQEQFKRMVASVSATATTSPVIIPASNGGDDYAINQYPIDMPTAYMWNDLAMREREKFNLFMLASDDIIFSTPGWDKALIDHYNALENKIHVYHLQDSRDKEGTPHPIFTREWIESMGWMVPPYFLHWKIDTWSVEIAKANNCFTHLKDYLLIHDKPNDRGKPDETHNRIRRNGWHARDMQLAEQCSYILEYEKQRLAERMK